MSESAIAATARAIRAMRAYPIPARQQEFDKRMARARSWLAQTTATTTDDCAMRLLGLIWAGGAKPDVRKAAEALVALQRADGGWAGNPYLKSDAYATAEALVALSEWDAHAEPYRRGVAFLLSTQYPDGSWYVRSRAIKFQPYFESGFPFGHDQWISTAATALAVKAIAAAGI